MMACLRERVARAIEETMFAPHELPATGELHERYLLTADAALAEAQRVTPEMVTAAIEGDDCDNVAAIWRAMWAAAMKDTS